MPVPDRRPLAPDPDVVAALRSRAAARLRWRRRLSPTRTTSSRIIAARRAAPDGLRRRSRWTEILMPEPAGSYHYLGQTTGSVKLWRPADGRWSSSGSNIVGSTLTPLSASLSVRCGLSPVAFIWPWDRPMVSVPIR